ncbi:MAG TPA: sodium:solute symporter family protein [Methanofastidiosum sp.]|nr:sodium:solute symporter family protein [Methanofastidiosum sp.]HNU61187.1 sodium:solute symporter family protein [Methanofastidiosum sp.]
MENTAISIVVIFCYLAVTGFLAHKGWKETKNKEDYMLAGRNVHPYIIAISYGATFISTSAIVGFGGSASMFGMGLLWLTFMNIFVGIFLAFVVWGNRARHVGQNLGALTFPEIVGKRFDSKILQGSFGLLITIFMPLYTSVVIIGAARMIESTFNLNFNLALIVMTGIVAGYVLFGGLLAVLYTDALQGTIMAIGMILLLVGTYAAFGGITEAHQSLENFQLTDSYSMLTNKGAPLSIFGHQGFTSFPTMSLGNTPADASGLNDTQGIFWSVLMGLIFGVGVGVLAQPQLAVRCMTAKNKRDLTKAVGIGGVFILLMTGVAFTVGSLTNAYFEKEGVEVIKAEYNPGLSNQEIRDLYFKYDASGKLVGRPSEYVYWTDSAIPEYVNYRFPSWFVILFMITLISAAMSTISGQFHAMGTSFGHDFYHVWVKNASEKINAVTVTKIGIGATVLVSLALGYMLPPAIIARGTTIFMGMCSAVFLPAYTGALFWKKSTRMGAIASMVGGFLSWIIWTLFFKASESEPLRICQWIFGKPVLLNAKASLTQLDPFFIAIPISIALMIIVSLMTKPPEKKLIDKAFKGL